MYVEMSYLWWENWLIIHCDNPYCDSVLLADLHRSWLLSSVWLNFDNISVTATNKWSVCWIEMLKMTFRWWATLRYVLVVNRKSCFFCVCTCVISSVTLFCLYFKNNYSCCTASAIKSLFLLVSVLFTAHHRIKRISGDIIHKYIFPIINNDICVSFRIE